MTGTPTVTIVGAGPVGLTLAALLGAAGHAVSVLDRRAAPVDEPRAVHLDHHAARVLDAAGVMAALEPRTEAMDAYEWRSAAGEVLLRLQPKGLLGRAGWPDSLMFRQPDLEALLQARVDGLATVQVARGVEVTELDGLDGWVVGCDGANSIVRELAGIPMHDDGYSFEWLVVDVLEADPRRWRPCNVQVCDPARPTTAVSGGPGRRRFEFMCLPGEDPAQLAGDPWPLLGRWGLGPATTSVERSAVYRFGARMVETWGKGRVLLAGDAAHQMPPFAGRGVCAGLRDAMNVAWKLDMVLRGAAPPALLATYGTERAAPVRFEIDVSVELGRIICVSDPAEAAARDAAMAEAFALSGPIPPPPEPPLGPGLLAAGDPMAGTLAVQGTVDGRRVDEAVGRGWILYGRAGDPTALLPASVAAWWSSVGGRGVDCSALGSPYLEWFDEAGAPVVLVRPDFAVYGTAAEPAGAGRLVADLRDRLADPGATEG